MTGKDNIKLIELYQLGYTFPEIAVKMDRSRFAVQSKMYSLRLQGRAGYRTSKSEAAVNERGLFKPQPVEFEDNGVMIRPSYEETEQAERAEQKAITTESQMIDINLSDLKSINTYLFMLIVKNAAGYYAQRTKSQIVTIFGKNFWICESKKQICPRSEERRVGKECRL